MWRLVLVFAIACSKSTTPVPNTGSDAPPPSGIDAAACTQPIPDAGTCSCAFVGDGYRWVCNTCPFGEGSDPVACTTPNAGCGIETWEHECDCTCLASGWWSCANETVGTHCPQAPPVDAAVD